MRFLVSKCEFDFIANKKDASNINFKLNSATSVNKLKAHFFKTIGQLGEIIKVDVENNIDEIKKICLQEDVIFVSFHEIPPEGLSCRLLQHTKGGLMLTGGFLNKWTFGSSTMNIVTTQNQANQLKKGLGDAAPLLGVFVPEIDSNTFRFPSEKEKENARANYGLNKNDFHIVYAGRIISNKGICQLVRAANLWNEKNVIITIIGDFEPDFFIYQSNANHTTFSQFFQREIIEKSKHKIVYRKALKSKELRKAFWSANCFVYPSFHEDENFGITPREAILCGTPVIVTDFCGLGELKQTHSGILTTFPTLGGVRFSLNQLTEELQKIKNWNENEKQKNIEYNAEYVKNECCTEKATASLKQAAEKLLQLKPEEPIGDWRSNIRLNKWIKKAPKNFKKAFELAKYPTFEGLYVDGTGEYRDEFSDAHFLTAIQSLYTTHSDILTVEKQISYQCDDITYYKYRKYQSFWRIALWQEEQSIVEFGFPGPRIKKYNNEDWHLLIMTTRSGKNELCIKIEDDNATQIIDELLLLGYLVPINFNSLNEK